VDALLHHLPGKDGTRPSVSLQLIAHYPPLACLGAGLASRINSRPSSRAQRARFAMTNAYGG
jgi:hypothetical protein